MPLISAASGIIAIVISHANQAVIPRISGLHAPLDPAADSDRYLQDVRERDNYPDTAG